jgi:hypothetical protein
MAIGFELGHGNTNQEVAHWTTGTVLRSSRTACSVRVDKEGACFRWLSSSTLKAT